MEGAVDQDLMNILNEYWNMGDEEWEANESSWVNPDFADPSANSAKNWKKKNIATNSEIVIKMLNIFPGIEVDNMVDLISNLENRIKWDDRWVGGSILERTDDSAVMYAKTPKPPIPLVSERELLLKFFKVKDWQEGKTLCICKSVEHPSKPIATGMFATVRADVKIQAVVIEAGPNGGSQMTEIRHMAMGGSIPGVAIQKMMGVIPVKSFDVIQGAVANRIAGKI